MKILDESYKSYLVEKYGSPLFIVDEKYLEDNFNKLSSSFKSVYKNTRIAYSVKTNYVLAICKKLFDLGASPEVISGVEIDLIKKIGYLSNDIIVNGPAKSEDEIIKVIEVNGLINIDSFDELIMIDSICQKMDRKISIGIRVNYPIEHKTWSRFGFKLNSIQLKDALLYIEKSSNLSLIGFHMHLGTLITDLSVYQVSFQALDKYIQENIDVSSLLYIDVGGGYATSGAKPKNIKGDWVVPSFLEYASAIISSLEYSLTKNNNIEIIIEPGRALIDKSISILSTVLSVDNDTIIIDAGKNILPSIAFREHTIINKINKKNNLYTVNGPLCMGSDTYGQVSISNTNKEDILQILNAGAYSISQSWNFIKYFPAVVMLKKDSTEQVIRRQEQIEDFLKLDMSYE